MGKSVQNNGMFFGLIAIVLAVGTWSLCRGSTDCFWVDRGETQPANAAVRPAETVIENPKGEEDMSTASTHGQVYHADEATFGAQVLQSDVTVLVDFYADWCRPCQMVAPVLEEIARETPGGKVVKVNVDDNRALASRYGIRSIPSLLVFKDGQVVSEHVGLADKEQMRALLGG